MNTDTCYQHGWIDGPEIRRRMKSGLAPGYYRADFDDHDYQVARWDGSCWTWAGWEEACEPTSIHPEPISFSDCYP